MDALVVQLAKKARGDGEGGGDAVADDGGDDESASLDKVEKSAVADLMSALDEGDADGVGAALSDYFRACMKRYGGKKKVAEKATEE